MPVDNVVGEVMLRAEQAAGFTVMVDGIINDGQLPEPILTLIVK